MRSISRVADVSINTVSKLLVDAGLVCIELHDEMVRDRKASRVQCDEIRSCVFYSFIRFPKTLNMSPAMAAGVSVRLWSMEDLVAAIDAREVPQKRGSYKKRAVEISN